MTFPENNTRLVPKSYEVCVWMILLLCGDHVQFHLSFVLGGWCITPLNPRSSAIMPFVVASGLKLGINTDTTIRGLVNA